MTFGGIPRCEPRPPARHIHGGIELQQCELRPHRVAERIAMFAPQMRGAAARDGRRRIRSSYRPDVRCRHTHDRRAIVVGAGASGAWALQRHMPQWSRASINAAIATGQRQDIHLPKTCGPDLSHGTDDQRPERSVAQRHLRPGRAASGRHRRRGYVLQPGGQSSPDGASCAVSLLG